MTERLEISFSTFDAKPEATTVVLAGDELAMGERTRALDKRTDSAITEASGAAEFHGAAKSSIEILAPRGGAMRRLIVLGVGKASEAGELDLINLGGQAMGQILARKGKSATLMAELPGLGGQKAAQAAADMALGALLRQYEFSKYKTRRKDEENGHEKDGLIRLVVQCDQPEKAEECFARHRAVAKGVMLARDLVNEPANTLGPLEFAACAEGLSASGLEVSILDEAAMQERGMGALLAVSQGSARPARLVVMQWNGAKSKRTKPVCFVGKGVVFDTGGISMKPAAGMEDMKGDMAGAACVTGLMLALAERKAAVNAVGLIGVVENMPSATATRPGDIVTSMSGQTIEVLNTDAEGRLVLADVVHYAQEEYKPRLIIDLATLTGAIIVALGKEYAGLFCNDDKLANELCAAGEATGDKVWRMPLSREYDKLMDSKNADMKNIGGRWGGAITGAQFIGRFIKDGLPWGHIDLAGVAMDSKRSDTSTGWASGWGVRLLDRLVSDNYEKTDK